MAEALSDDDTHGVKLLMNVDGEGKVYLCSCSGEMRRRRSWGCRLSWLDAVVL